MKDIIYLLLHLLTSIAKLIQPGGSRAVIAGNLLLKQQLIIHSRSRQRAPNLTTQDRTVLGFLSLFLSPRRLLRSAIIIKPSTLLSFHNALKKRKYRLLYSPRGGRKPGPKGPSKEVIKAIVEMKQRNPRYGCPRIAQQINLAFGPDLDKDTVRRVLAVNYKPDPSMRGPSWLTTLGHAKDSLWSVDLFRAESITLRTHWIMVVMDQYSRRIIGFAVHAGNVDGPAVCRMFNDATCGIAWPERLSSDNDPPFQYHRWKSNLRILDIEEIKSLPHVPTSHPFVERLIGSVRRELLDQTFFWTATDLDNKLRDYQHYYNEHRCHSSRDSATPAQPERDNVISLKITDGRNTVVDCFSYRSRLEALIRHGQLRGVTGYAQFPGLSGSRDNPGSTAAKRDTSNISEVCPGFRQGRGPVRLDRRHIELGGRLPGHSHLGIRICTRWDGAFTQRAGSAEPVDFIARLAALVPKPRVNLIRYHGVLARGGPVKSFWAYHFSFL